MHLGQIIFDLIVLHRCEANMSQKLPFPSLIFGLLEGEKPLQELNEFLSAPVQPYVFRMKEKSANVKRERSRDVAIGSPVATKTQKEQSSTVGTSCFSSKL